MWNMTLVKALENFFDFWSGALIMPEKELHLYTLFTTIKRY
ncbi:hypothetical protein [Methanobacterium petrolearium]|nr:hypothetical protein [Methanobacterium petrolearium]